MKKALLLIILPVLTIAAISCSKKSGSDNLPEPVITGITTDYGGKAIAGKPVQLNGTNFSSKITDVEVLMGVGLDSKALEVTEATETKIVFIAPTIERNQVKIRVSIKGKESRSVMLEFWKVLKPLPSARVSSGLLSTVCGRARSATSTFCAPLLTSTTALASTTTIVTRTLWIWTRNASIWMHWLVPTVLWLAAIMFVWTVRL